jgi:hypothetical protein
MSDSITALELERLKTLNEVAVPLHVGRATIAWNTLSGAVFDVFHLLSGADEETAKSVFFAVASDRSQRDMVTNLIELKLASTRSSLAKRGRKLMDRANGLAGKRNDILHVVYDEVLKPDEVTQRVERGHLKSKTGSALLEAIHEFTMQALGVALEVQEFRRDVWKSLFPIDQLMGELHALGILRPSAEEVANRGLYGLLVPATTQPSSPQDPQD